ncbi:MAG: hypothetical protein PHI79_05785 [Sulfurovaceae bacterium]|nr:hypothetical protein [Sulfurovaceae bacterium]MDD5549088.1 hypothetical protein [Sulfurovaceae bacterium]
MKILILLTMFLAGCTAETKEYKSYLDKYYTTSRFYCVNNVLINEYFNDTTATTPAYRIIMINNATVKCINEPSHIYIPDLDILVEIKE